MNKMASKLKLKKRKHHPPFEESSNQTQIDDEKTKKLKENMISNTDKTCNESDIFTRAIASAQKHNIKMKPGRKNRAEGNCSYRVIFIDCKL